MKDIICIIDIIIAIASLCCSLLFFFEIKNYPAAIGWTASFIGFARSSFFEFRCY